MARHDDLLKGAAIGIGLTLLAPVLVSAAMPVVRPLARSVVKAGVRVYERGREVLEEFNEAVDDVRAEVQQDLRDALERESGADAIEEPAGQETEIG